MRCKLCNKAKSWTHFSVRMKHNDYKHCDKCFKRGGDDSHEKMKTWADQEHAALQLYKKPKPEPLVKKVRFVETDEEARKRFNRVVESYEETN